MKRKDRAKGRHVKVLKGQTAGREKRKSQEQHGATERRGENSSEGLKKKGKEEEASTEGERMSAWRSEPVA